MPLHHPSDYRSPRCSFCAWSISFLQYNAVPRLPHAYDLKRTTSFRPSPSLLLSALSFYDPDSDDIKLSIPHYAQPLALFCLHFLVLDNPGSYNIKTFTSPRPRPRPRYAQAPRPHFLHYRSKTPVHSPHEALAKGRQLVQHTFLQHQASVQRHEAHHGAD